MQNRDFRHRVVTGSFTLPVTAVLTALLWIAGGAGIYQGWEALGLTALLAYLLVELNNRFALIRIRSRMMGVTFLALIAACPFLQGNALAYLPAIGLTLAYFPLFAGYQSPRTSHRAFYAFLAVGLSAWAYPPLILLAPILLFGMAVQLRSLSGRTLVSALLGLLTPAWLLLGWGLWTDRVPSLFAPLIDAFRFQPPDYAVLSRSQWVSVVFLATLSLPAILHFIRYAYNDKIRTRMYFYLFLIVEIILWGALAVQPQAFDALFRLLLVNSAPLIGHYFALARGRFMNAWFILWLLLLVALAGFNYLSLWTQ